jgi:hypothetical protein
VSVPASPALDSPAAIDVSHLNSLRLALSHERSRLESASTEGERVLRAVWVSQLEREIAAELTFLEVDDGPVELDDDDLLAALGG